MLNDLFTSAEQIAIFVQNAEERIYNSVQIPAIRKNMTGATTSGNKYLALPPDWLSTFSLAVVCNGPTTLPDGRVFASGDYVYLLNKDVNFIREALGYGTIVDETQVLVPTNYMPLADMRSGDLEVDTVPSGRNVPREEEDIEDDGSLNHGFELVTGYTGLDVHEKQLGFFKKPIRFSFSFYNRCSCF